MEPTHIKHIVELIKGVYFITSSQDMSGKSFLHSIILSPKERKKYDNLESWKTLQFVRVSQIFIHQRADKSVLIIFRGLLSLIENVATSPATVMQFTQYLSSFLESALGCLTIFAAARIHVMTRRRCHTNSKKQHSLNLRRRWSASGEDAVKQIFLVCARKIFIAMQNVPKYFTTH